MLFVCSCSVDSIDKSFVLGLLFYLKTESMLASFTLKTEAFDLKQSELCECVVNDDVTTMLLESLRFEALWELFMDPY
jgi:hypothetical protein